MRRNGLWCLLVFLCLILGPALAAAAGGSGYFSREYNWKNSPNLYYSVAGAPPNTCGDLWITRNGAAWTSGSGWICTDANGNATKGPWSWTNQVGDETAYAYIRWPDGTSTTTDRHVWDKTCPTISFNPSNGYPPYSFRGWANDTTWGAGFDSRWSICETSFYNMTTNKYWNPSPGGSNYGYSVTSSTPVWRPCHLYGMPSMSITWSASQLPSLGEHTPGYYRWTACVTDGPANEGCRKCLTSEFYW